MFCFGIFCIFCILYQLGKKVNSYYQKLGHIVQQIFRGTLTLSLSLEKGEGVRKNGFLLLFEERIKACPELVSGVRSSFDKFKIKG
jgi:hypothetical protein